MRGEKNDACLLLWNIQPYPALQYNGIPSIMHGFENVDLSLLLDT